MAPDRRPVSIPLTDANLPHLHESVRVPNYRRNLLRPGLVHIGVGGFNRSHLAVYLDDLAATGDSQPWGEFGIGLLSADLPLHTALSRQDFLYSLLQRDHAQQSLRVVGSLMGHLYAPNSSKEVLARLSSPVCQIVSMTVTEGGYFLDSSTGAFIDQHPDIQWDLNHPEAPRTWVGYVAEAAERRMKAGHPPFTVLSCDNLSENGRAARSALSSFAALKSHALSRWIEENVSFPNSMVDRITPRTTAADQMLIATEYGIEDLCPVVSEPFRQWVLEDVFATGRPAWERAGVQMTTDVRPYELMKMRLLNGGHSAIAYPAALLGLSYVAEAANDPLLQRLLACYLAEVRPLIPPLAGIDLDDYIDSVIRRFGNENIRDQVSRICFDGTAKITRFILPSIDSLLAQGKKATILSFVIAGWLRYLVGSDEAGKSIEVVDASYDLFQPFRAAGGKNAGIALSERRVFGDLAHAHPCFVRAVQTCLDDLGRVGVRDAMRLAMSRAEAA